MESLSIRSGARGLTALVGRALALDSAALARVQEVGGSAVDVFVTTPFECFASRRILAHAPRNHATVSAADLLAALQEGRSDIGPARDASWPGALPPVGGFVERDTVPVGVASRLADEGRSLARQFSGPAGPPKSLLNSVVLTADAESEAPVEIPMRMIFTCTSLGLIPGFEAPAEVPRHLRISTAGRWTRIDAPYGSVYHSARLNLLF